MTVAVASFVHPYATQKDESSTWAAQVTLWKRSQGLGPAWCPQMLHVCSLFGLPVASDVRTLCVSGTCLHKEVLWTCMLSSVPRCLLYLLTWVIFSRIWGSAGHGFVCMWWIKGKYLQLSHACEEIMHSFSSRAFQTARLSMRIQRRMLALMPNLWFPLTHFAGPPFAG